MLLKALLFSVITFAIAMAVSMVVALIIKVIATWAHNREEKTAATAPKS
jgi:hypothetical protein